jgi:2-polyprenyl-3-methyl-5-hydroxy-6-metoxy-1,4-benzoquinol methylase
VWSSNLNKSKDEIETIESFNYQWSNLTNAKHILSDKNWTDNVQDYILDELQVEREWLNGKTVIDVGCGGGRWTYGFAKLGCKVTASDVSDGPCNYTKQHIPEAEVIQSDLFELPEKFGGRKFDVVWCWGVIHHTANPKLAFDILTKLMRPDGGIIHLYVYSLDRGNRVKLLRKILGIFSLKTRERLIRFMIKSGLLHGDVHGCFDALSPKLNFEIDESDLKEWFSSHQLSYRSYVPQWVVRSGDIFATGERID